MGRRPDAGGEGIGVKPDAILGAWSSVPLGAWGQWTMTGVIPIKQQGSGATDPQHPTVAVSMAPGALSHRRVSSFARGPGEHQCLGVQR